jgi:hypothetical protein
MRFLTIALAFAPALLGTSGALAEDKPAPKPVPKTKPRARRRREEAIAKKP